MHLSHVVDAPIADVAQYLPSYLRTPAPDGSLMQLVERAAGVNYDRVVVTRTGTRTFQLDVVLQGHLQRSTYRLVPVTGGTRIDVDVQSTPPAGRLAETLNTLAYRAFRGEMRRWRQGLVDHIARERHARGIG